MLYIILHRGDIELSREIGTAIYTGVVSDTGNFQFSNTRPHVFDIAAACASAGAEPSKIAELLFERKLPGMLTLAGHVFTNMQIECDGEFCWAELRQEQYDQVGGEEMEPEGLVGELRGIKGVNLAILMHELKDGSLRASLRSRGHIDCREIASRIGGGGHKYASGVLIRQKYEEAQALILSEARAVFEK
jgi:phosphoesterase RecJ-like protein